MSCLANNQSYQLALTDRFLDLPESSVPKASTKEFRYQPLPDNKSFIRLLYLRSKNLTLEHLRHHEKTLVIWADAVGIDQSDNVEKGHQVQIMSRIYKSAALVIAWLGLESDDSDDAIKQLQDVKELVSSAMGQIDEIGNMFESGEGEELPRRRTIDFLPVKRLLERPWFSRIWVLQEAVLNDDILFLTGQSCLEPDALF
ncbi:heterokaryon incompatibility protein-domain-containing protein [Nemania abortiva]|nr:heterokaryon incompatibility protein-domain-containing protein [Nemania abortiva]